MTNQLPLMCRKRPERLKPPFGFFRVNTKWLHRVLFRLEAEVTPSPLSVCGEQRGRKRSDPRKQPALEDKIWQIHSRSGVKATFSSFILQKCVSNPPPCHVRNLTSPDTQNHQQEFYRLGKKKPLFAQLSRSFQLQQVLWFSQISIPLRKRPWVQRIEHVWCGLHLHVPPHTLSLKLSLIDSLPWWVKNALWVVGLLTTELTPKP